jgi:16S rRNA (guanine1516-N2)-methyltransferase
LAENLARELKLRLVTKEASHYGVLLVHTDARLELRQTGSGAPGPVFVDFAAAGMRYRLKHGGSLRQMLARAAGLKSGVRPDILDATAGLGRDAFVLAALGCRVTLIERNPIIAALLADGLRTALVYPELAEIIRERMHLIRGDSVQLIREIRQTNRPQTLYLDPMYPARTKNAQVKKEMRVLRQVTGDDSDAPALLACALEAKIKRVVVKRPRLAPPLGDCPPSVVLRGSNSRYDIYLNP